MEQKQLIEAARQAATNTVGTHVANLAIETAEDRLAYHVRVRWCYWSILHRHGINRAEIARLVNRDRKSVCHGLEALERECGYSATLATLRFKMHLECDKLMETTSAEPHEAQDASEAPAPSEESSQEAQPRRRRRSRKAQPQAV